MTWTHNGTPLGPKPRPWRLTRGQRVEMEAALARLRGDPDMVPEDAFGMDVPEGFEVTLGDIEEADGDRAFSAHDGDPPDDAWTDVYVLARTLRARVAIALRAALRADEDARCEEANAQIDESEILRVMCEWREMRRGFGHDRRTLAEIARLPRSVWTWAAGSKEESERNLNADGERLYGIRIEATIPLALWERASLLPEPSTAVGG